MARRKRRARSVKTDAPAMALDGLGIDERRADNAPSPCAKSWSSKTSKPICMSDSRAAFIRSRSTENWHHVPARLGLCD